MKTHKINLLPKKAATWDEKIIYFGLHYLRYIIVLTQIVVLTVFFYRFKVDQDIVELRESVTEKRQIISVAKELLNQASFVSEKSKYVRGLLDEQKSTDQLIDRAFAYIPKQVVITSVVINTKKVTLQGYSLKENYIKLFYDRLIQILNTRVIMKSLNNTKGLYTFELEFIQ
jgi:transcriptional regulator of heat shock response